MDTSGSYGLHFLAGIMSLDADRNDRDISWENHVASNCTNEEAFLMESVRFRDNQTESKQQKESVQNTPTSVSSLAHSKVTDVNVSPGSSIQPPKIHEPTRIINNNVESIPSSNLWRCKQCPVAFEDCGVYTEHMREHMESSQRAHKQKKKSNVQEYEDNSWNLYGRLVCNFCEKSFESLSSFSKHVKTHIGDKKHICIKCGRSFLSKYKLKDHFLNMHMEKILYNCNFCNKGFNHKYIIRSHILKVHLMKNNKLIKEGPKRFPCTNCNKAFEYQSQLKIHFRSHSGEKSFMCNICGKSYGMKATLQKHLNLHENDMECNCYYCNSNFSSKVLLYEHLKIHYNNNEKLPCKTCNKSFRSLQRLLDHTRTHSGDKPFICEHCGKSFALAGNMRKHQKRVHKLQVQFRCTKFRCTKMFPTKEMLDFHFQSHLINMKNRRRVDNKIDENEEYNKIESNLPHVIEHF